jgi:hypothetical protein
MKDLYGKALNAAQSWADNSIQHVISMRKSDLSSAAHETNVEQWAINKALHYNAWANFGKKDFEPVVAAFQKLLNCFNCGECNSWLYATPKINPEALRCNCNATNFNLKSKSKE